MLMKLNFKSHSRLFNVLIGLLIFMVTSCYNESDYSGDGQLIDNGSSVATDRYVLNLGTVDLSKESTKTYLVKNLPDKFFVAGIDLSVDSINQDVIADQKINTIVYLSLIDSVGEEIFSNKGRLANWTWAVWRNNPTSAFIYGSGGGLKETHFEPKPNAEYKLTFSVLEVDPNAPKYSAALILKSRGWK